MIIVYKLASPSVPFNLWHPIQSAAVCVKQVGRNSGRSWEDRRAHVQKQVRGPAPSLAVSLEDSLFNPLAAWFLHRGVEQLALHLACA